MTNERGRDPEQASFVIGISVFGIFAVGFSGIALAISAGIKEHPIGAALLLLVAGLAFASVIFFLFRK